jgi:hypothetical protein
MYVSDIRESILPLVPGVPSSVIDLQVRQTLIDFYARTQTWKWVSDTVMLVKDLNFYDIETLPYTRMSRMLRVSLGTKDLQPVEEMILRGMQDEGRTGVEFYSVTTTDELMIGPKVDRTGDVRMEMTLVPTSSINSIPDTVLAQYQSVIADGALYRILSMPQGWNDAKLAAAYRKAYEAGVYKATNERDKDKFNVKRTVAYGGL